MTSQTTSMQTQEIRRQAMLQAMQVDVWLPRQPLLHAAAAREDLLDWQTPDQLNIAPVLPSAVQHRAPVVETVATVAPQHTAAPTPNRAYVSVRDKLALAQAQPTAKAQPVSAVVAPVVEATAAVTPVVEPSAPIPRFALQILRADNCLLLVDLPTGEAFQSRDPDYQLLKDMLRAAGLTDQPQFLRQGTPFVWPMLRGGQLMGAQHADAARACVRDLLSMELHNATIRAIWLVGQQAVRFGNADESTPLYSPQPFMDNVQLWSLPSLETVLEQPLLKREIWQSMCAVRNIWQVQHDE